MKKYVLAIDLGTSGCKAALVDFFGEVAGWDFRAVKTLLPHGGGAEQDPADWWKAITAACASVIRETGVKPSAIAAVCANTQGEGTLPVDRNGEPLCNAILWMDTRGAAHVKKRLGGPVNVAGFAPHKLLRFLRLTGGAPSLTGKDPVGHMLLIKHEMPDIFRRTHKFLNVLDYVNFKLTGRIVSTVDSLVTSWVTDNRDPRRVTLDAELCRMIGVPPEKIPEPVPCTEILGEVDAKFAAAVGLAPGTPVVAGAIDATAAAVGSGAIADGDVHLYLGTSNWLGAHVPYKKTDLLSAIASLPCAIPDKYLMIALQATACGNLNFLVDKILFPDDALRRGGKPKDVYALLDQVAETSPPGANGLIYTPWIYGERAPVEDRSVRAGIHNLSLEHTRADLARAVLEGVALNIKWVLKPVEKFLGKRCAVIAVVGGGAKSAIWRRILADVLDRPIRGVKKPIEANVRGSAFMAAVALGEMSFSDVPARVGVETLHHPSRENREVYDLHFREFKNLYDAEKGVSKRLNAFHHRER
jgi:xylulokinase